MLALQGPTTMSRTSGGATLGEVEGVYRARFPEFMRVATAITGNAESGRDAVQDAFVRAVRHRARFRREGPLDAWIWRLVTNAARDEVSRQRRRAAEPVSAPADANGSRADEADYELRVAVALLPERQRLALFLRYYADLDYTTIGDVLAVRPGTVAATLSAAHRALERRLREKGE